VKVLIADDDELTRRILEKNLSNWQYETVTAADGMQAWEILKADESIQLAILDWLMPGLQGIELSFKIKTDLHRPVYVLLLTVNAEPEDIAVGLDAGADEYVVKPFNKRELRARLRAGERIVKLEMDLIKRVKELEETEEKLKRSNQELEAFAFIASHDLSEPVRKVRVFSERLQATAGDLLPQQSLHYLDRISSAAKRMERLVQGLLELSRASGSLDGHISVDLNVVAREVLSDLEITIDGLEASIDLAELPVVVGDPLQMRQLLQNLISNALKFHLPGTPPEVKIYSDHKDERAASIVVEDNGIGFDTKQVEQIFLPFKRLHGRSEYEGSGIGLALCRKIVDSHNGQIAVESQKGKGSRFVVTLTSATD
jgi:light-regulated signal transduction histidine kinase (bacteriophytochrome)